jgi:dTDP-glucose 4,6-dehydratase
VDLPIDLAGRDVLVTGGNGFLGSHLVDSLLESQARVSVLVHATSTGGLRNIAHAANQIRIFRGDLTDKHSTDELFKGLATVSSEPVVFHLGAQAHVAESWKRPYNTLSTNVVGTFNVLQSIVDSGVHVAKFVMAGTSEEYGRTGETLRPGLDVRSPDEPVALSESSPVNPKSVYATSKVASSFLALNFYDSYGIPVVISRMFNNYGPRQSPRFITGEVIVQALERDHIELGPLEPARDFTYYEDGVRGLIAVARAGRPGEIYAYGHGECISIGEWAEKILQIGQDMGYWGSKPIRTNNQRFRPGASEVLSLRADNRKIRRDTGWEPNVSWDLGLKRTIDWYAAHRSSWIDRVSWIGKPFPRTPTPGTSNSSSEAIS